MKKLTMVFVISVVLMAFGFNVVTAAEAQPKVFKMGFMSSLSGTFAAVSETQRKGVLLAVEQKNAAGGLNMPWGKVKIEVSTKDDEAKLDVAVRRFRELVAEGIHGLVGTNYNPMAGAFDIIRRDNS